MGYIQLLRKIVHVSDILSLKSTVVRTGGYIPNKLFPSCHTYIDIFSAIADS